jgi:hypothetical protein
MALKLIRVRGTAMKADVTVGANEQQALLIRSTELALQGG